MVAENLGAQDKWGTEHRDPVVLFHDHARQRSGQALPRAPFEQPGIVLAGEEVVERGAVHAARHQLAVGVVDLDGQVVHGRVLLEGGAAPLELEDGHRLFRHRSSSPGP
jgi:hypothetical protein